VQASGLLPETTNVASVSVSVNPGDLHDYIDRRTKEGLTKKEAFRCLKRYIAREVYNHLPREHLALDSP